MKTSDFIYDLPEELIAQTPAEKRDTSRLMVLDKHTGAMEHRHFYDLPEFLQRGDCLVLNDSRVIPARLFGTRESGGVTEIMLLKDRGGDCWECLARPGKKCRPGTIIDFAGKMQAEVLDVFEDGNDNGRERGMEFVSYGAAYQLVIVDNSIECPLKNVDLYSLHLVVCV